MKAYVVTTGTLFALLTLHHGLDLVLFRSALAPVDCQAAAEW